MSDESVRIYSDPYYTVKIERVHPYKVNDERTWMNGELLYERRITNLDVGAVVQAVEDNSSDYYTQAESRNFDGDFADESKQEPGVVSRTSRDGQRT